MPSGRPKSSKISTSKEVDSQEYLVEKIVGKRFRDGRLQFLVKWQGFPEEENSWEPLEGVGHLSYLLADFEAEEYKRSQEKKAPLGASSQEAEEAPRSSKQSKGSPSKTTKRRNSRAVDSGKAKRVAPNPNAAKAVINVSFLTKSNAKSPTRRRQSRYMPVDESSDHAAPSTSSNTEAVDQGTSEHNSSLNGCEEQPTETSVVDDPVGLPLEHIQNSPLDAEQELDWRLPPYTKPFGLARGLELSKVHHCFFVREQLFLFVSWKGCSSIDAVLLRDVQHAFPIPIIKYFESISVLNDDQGEDGTTKLHELT
ncbi:chromobox protein homolog 2-like [Drosophila teissieri]|uniref:chromobox protein homolog 2-like n=1 Tax=Drosophila teissieri TaxID=7243 RepID=UPI001CBA4CB5|nr:chromobox protein homolog 2-like [Drosophila teissieri]